MMVCRIVAEVVEKAKSHAVRTASCFEIEGIDSHAALTDDCHEREDKDRSCLTGQEYSHSTRVALRLKP